MKLLKKRLDAILVDRKLAKNKTNAKALTMAGQVFVEGKQITKSGNTFLENVEIIVKELQPAWVSRGAIKLLKAINFFNISVKDKICLDLGSSTGGFTEVLFKNKAKKIYSIDVGTNQLHERLLKKKNIISIEKTNARYLNKDLIKDEIDIMVCDVSFISLKKVIKPNLFFLKNNSLILALIKPQFEVEKKNLKKGIVRDSNIHINICENIKNWFETECNTKFIGLIDSPIKGPKGNKEFFIAVQFIGSEDSDQQ